MFEFTEFLLTLDIKSHGIRATTSPSRQVDGSALRTQEIRQFPLGARSCLRLIAAPRYFTGSAESCLLRTSIGIAVVVAIATFRFSCLLLLLGVVRAFEPPGYPSSDRFWITSAVLNSRRPQNYFIDRVKVKRVGKKIEKKKKRTVREIK